MFVCGALPALAAGAIAGTDSPNDWPSYHRSLDGWRYSPLDQIDRSNVSDLQVAWVHQPGDITGGLQATPLAEDGIVYYSGSYNRVFAIDGTTGREKWHYYTELADSVDRMIFQPYSRGVALSADSVFIGTLDGRAIALDKETGQERWQTTLVDAPTCNCNFTSPPLRVNDVLIYGPTGGDIFQRGRIYGISATTGEAIWTFETLKDDPASWGSGSIELSGGGGWMPGSYDAETHTLLWGTGNPAPVFDWGGTRDGDNLYTSSVIALDPDTGELKWYHQEIPHDNWDYDATSGEFLVLKSGGGSQVVHLNKSGYVFVYGLDDGRINNIWPLGRVINFVDGINPENGALIGRRDPVVGAKTLICPWSAGTRSWNHGAYSPKTGLWYTAAGEICSNIEIFEMPEEYITEGTPAYNLLEDLELPEGGAQGRLDAVNPLTGDVAWSVPFDQPPLGSVLATAGDLAFIGDVLGAVHAFDADTGEALWSFNTGSGIRGGIISYTANGDQYILVPSGMGGIVWSQGYVRLWPEIAHLPMGAALFAFKLGG